MTEVNSILSIQYCLFEVSRASGGYERAPLDRFIFSKLVDN